MLKSVLIAVALSAIALVAPAQTMKEFLMKPEMPFTFMGVDFTDAKYYGDPGTVDGEEMKGLYTKINQLMVKEPEKYNLPKALRHNNMKYAIDIAESVNKKIDPSTIITPGDFSQQASFTPQTVEGLVSHYTYPAGSTGIGVVFVMEYMIKYKEAASFWVTFVDMDSKKMLYTEKIIGSAQGFGFRNHWAYCLYMGIKDIKSSQYNDWKRVFTKGS